MATYLEKGRVYGFRGSLIYGRVIMIMIVFG